MKGVFIASFILFFYTISSAQTTADGARPMFNLLNAFKAIDTTTGVSDTDADAFITATGITNATQQAAIKRLVRDLKGFQNGIYYTVNVWDSLVAIYPFVGGTASTHKFNLKDARDLDAAYRLTYTG